MSREIRNRPRRKLRTIRDRRGVPARRMAVERVPRRFELLMYWVKCNGICEITRGGKPAYVIIDPDSHPKLMQMLAVTLMVAPLRRRNPGGVFTLADQVFGDCGRTDLWMVLDIWNEGEPPPIEMLATTAGVEEVLATLHRIQHGMFS